MAKAGDAFALPAFCVAGWAWGWGPWAGRSRAGARGERCVVGQGPGAGGAALAPGLFQEGLEHPAELPVNLLGVQRMDVFVPEVAVEIDDPVDLRIQDDGVNMVGGHFGH